MSKGLGKVELFILKTLGEKESYPVTLLSDKYCRFCDVRFDKPRREMLYHSVARAVRSLERKGYVQTKKMAFEEFNPRLKRRHMRNNTFFPVYVKLVWRIDEPEF